MEAFLIPAVVMMLCLTAEAASWSIIMIRHALWLVEHPENEAGMATSGYHLFVAVLISSSLSLFAWMAFVHYATLHFLGECDLFHPVSIFVLPVCIQLTHIHLWSILARYTCLHTDMWPICSQVLSRMLRPILKTKDMGYYCIKFESWNRLSERAQEHRSLLTEFLDLLPDPVWTKDLNDRFTYVNRAICDKLLLCDYFHALGKTGLELSDEIKGHGSTYTFGEVCAESDAAVRGSMKPIRSMEHGLVDNRFLALQVLKAPIFKFNSKGAELTGTIGVGRDVTVAWLEHEQINRLIDAGQFEDACRLFKRHKQNFESMIQPNVNGNGNVDVKALL